jgi:hypothetical protein
MSADGDARLGQLDLGVRGSGGGRADVGVAPGGSRSSFAISTAFADGSSAFERAPSWRRSPPRTFAASPSAAAAPRARTPVVRAEKPVRDEIMRTLIAASARQPDALQRQPLPPAPTSAAWISPACLAAMPGANARRSVVRARRVAASFCCASRRLSPTTRRTRRRPRRTRPVPSLRASARSCSAVPLRRLLRRHAISPVELGSGGVDADG